MQPRILIAEDDDLQGSLLRTALEGRGYQAEIVTDGLEAVRRLRTGRYDLALLDYHMPEVDGHAAALLLRDFLAEADRPRLIAITAAASGLSAREGAAGQATFDAIVSKQIGLPALLAVVDDTLTDIAALNIALQAECRREALREARKRRRQRLAALLGAAPGLAMTCLFSAGLVWASASLQHVDAAMGAARQTTVLSAGTTTLIAALANAEMSERTYLATGRAADRAEFDRDLGQVDQLLVAPGSLAADGTAGFDAGRGPLAMVEGRVQTLSEQVRQRSVGRAEIADVSAVGRDVAERLWIWASDLVSGSQFAVLTGLQALRGNVRLLCTVLTLGILYGVWTAGGAWQRISHRSRPAVLPSRTLRLRPHAVATTTRLLLGEGERAGA